MNRVFLGLIFVTVTAPACTEQTDTPILAGQDVALTIVHTADLHSRFFPYYFAPGQIDKGLGLSPKTGQTTAVVGGIARVSSVVKCIRGIYSGISCDGITETAGSPTCPTCTASSAIAGPAAQRSLHLDSGDIFEGAPVFNQFNGEVEMRGMSEIGLSAMALGNHEFDKGSVNLAQQMQHYGGFPIMAANYIFGDPNDPTQPKLDKLITPYNLFNVDGLTVGVIGLGNLSSIQGIIEGGNSLGVRPLDSTQATADTVRVLRPQVDMLFVISHLGLDEDESVAASAAESQDQNLQIAKEGVDVIFGGHLHIVLNPPKDIQHFDKDPTTNPDAVLTGHTVLCHSGAFAKYVGRLDLVIHLPTDAEKAAGVRAAVKAYTYRIIPIDDSIKNDPAMDNLLEPYQEKMDQFLNLNQVYSIISCPTSAGTCPKVLRNDPNGGDSQLGNLVAASMRLRQEVQADIGITNSLGIRADFESGPLSLEEMYNVFPFDNTLTSMYLSGGEIQEMLDSLAQRSSDRGCKTQGQVSGVYFDMLCNDGHPECKRQCDILYDAKTQTDLYNACVASPPPCANNIYVGDRCRNADSTLRDCNDVASVAKMPLDPNTSPTSCCHPVDLFGEYKVAVNDYIANGGSGFSVLKRNTTKINTGISLRDALVDYIRTQPNRCDPQKNTNVIGTSCKDPQGETYDCSQTCCCPSSLQCTDAASGQQTDCTADCCCKDAAGKTVCDGTCAAYQGCVASGRAPRALCSADNTCETFTTCAQGKVQCTDATTGKPTDCTSDCCCHDDRSGPSICSSDINCVDNTTHVQKMLYCKQTGRKPVATALSPAVYDYRNTACLVPADADDGELSLEKHDGRIETFVGGAQ